MADPAKKDDLQCLTDDVIRRFLAGELDDEQDQVVSDHLDVCESCQRLTMSFLSVDDLCLPWVKASARETINLTRQTADTVTIRKLKLIGAAEHDASEQPSDFGGKLNSRRKEPVPDWIDKYEIVAAIGQGGMGTVYLGIDHDLGRECAIKVLRESRSCDRTAIGRALREMQAVGRLAHPNIVSVLNAGQLTDGRTFLVMEFLRGSDLQSYVQAYGPLSADEACRAIVEAARGLQHAHEQQLVHRDVKPSNLFRTDDGRIKVLDFGLVQRKHDSLTQSNSLTETGLVLGTVDFMSPEQALDSRSTDPRSDIYSLGCTLAWLLSGKQVFAGNSITRVLFAHRDTPAPQLESLQPNVPAGLNAVFQKMVAKRPEDRFQSTAEVIDALAPFTLMEHDEPIANLSPTSTTQLLPSPPLPPARSRRRATTAWLSGLVLLGIVITLMIRQSDGGRPEISIQTADSANAKPLSEPTSQALTVDSSTSEIRITIESDDSRTVVSPAPLSAPDSQTKTESLDSSVAEIDWKRAPVVAASPFQTLTLATDIPLEQAIPSGAVYDLDFSSDGAELLVAVGDNLQLWDVSDLSQPALRSTLRTTNETAVRAVERLPGSQSVLMVNSDHSAIVQQLDGEARRELDAGKGSAFTSLVLSQDGSRAWAGTYHAFGGRVLEFDLQAAIVSRWVQIEPELPGSACLRLSASPDETLLAAGGALEGGVALIETETFTERHRLPTLGPIRSLAFSADGSFVVTSSDQDCLRAWDVTTGKELWRVPNTGPCCGLEFSSDGSKLFIATYPTPNLRLMTLDVARRKILSIIDTPWACDSLAVDPQGQFLAAGNGCLSNLGNGRILIWKTDALLGQRPSEMPTTASTK